MPNSPLLWAGAAARFLRSALGIPGSTSGLLTIQTPAVVTDYTLTLPPAQGGSGDVLQNDGTGTLSWVPNAGGGGGGAAGNLTILEQKLGAEDYNIYTVPVPNSVGESFNTVQDGAISYLWEDYTSGTSAILVHDPVFLRATDEDTDSTTDWTTVSAADNLTATNTPGEFKIGTHALKFDKNNSNTDARIRYDAGSLTKSAAGNTRLFFWFYLPSLTDLVNIEVRIDKDLSNAEIYSVTTNSQGGALIVGWNFCFVDLSVPGTNLGTGWNPTELFRYFHIGVITGSATTTYTGLIVDGIVFSATNPASLGIKSYKRTIFNDSTAESLMVSSASTNSDGVITLNAGLSNAYVGGYKISTHAQVQRDTLNYLAGNAVMVNGLSGAIADTQTARAMTILPAALTAQDFQAAIAWNTDMTFTVTAVVDSDTIEVSDLADSTANIVSGQVFDVYESIPTPSGNNAYVSRSLALTVSSSSHSGGTTTINTGTNTGIAVGDQIVMRQLANVRMSLVGASANENFISMSTIERICYNGGLPYPVPTQILANWNLGGRNSTIATINNKSSVGAAGALGITGTISLNTPFIGNQFGAGPFTDSDYFSHPGAGIAGISSYNGLAGSTGIFSISLWVYSDSIPSGTQFFAVKTNSGGNGWGSGITGITGKLRLLFNSNLFESSNSFNVGMWNHVAFNWDTAAGINGNSMWLNGIETKYNGEPTFDEPTIALLIGRSIGAGNPFTSGKLAQFVAWANYKINQTIVDQIYNGGRGVIIGNYPSLVNRFELASASGQKLSIEADLTRTTDASAPFIQFMGACSSD